MITAAELAQIQRDVAAIALSLPCLIKRKTTTKDQFLTATDSWLTISPVGLLCGLTEPSAGQLANYDFLIGSLAAWQVKLPYGTDVQHQDQILVTGEFTQQTLTVQVVLEPRSYATLLTVLASEVK
jgi:hypothetical protein